MTQRQEIIERLNGLELEGGSHEMLSALGKAILPHSGAWTLRRCWDLRDRLVRLLGEAEQPKEQGEGGEYSMDELLRMLRTATSHDSCHGKMPEGWCSKYHHCVDCHAALIDAISAASCDELQRAYGDGYDAGYASADDWCAQHEDAMNEHGWYRALAADKTTIRIGDKVDSDHHEDGIVMGIQFYETPRGIRTLVAVRPDGWDVATWHMPDDYRHYHAPTVEDLLYDSLKHFGAVEERTPEVDSWVCEQAEKLREMLAGDAE